MEEINDIVVVGAGPAGLLTAYLLSRQGRKVLILERREKIERKVCGEYLGPLGVDVLRKLELESLLQGKYLPIHGMKIVTAYDQSLMFYFPNFHKSASVGYSLNREQFEGDLLNLCLSKKVEILFSKHVKSTHLKAHVQEVICDDGSIYRACLVIGADGRTSQVGKKFRLTDKAHLTALHGIVHTSTAERVGEMHLFEEGVYIGLNPINENELNLSLVCSGDVIKRYIHPLPTLKTYLNKSLDLKNRILEDTLISNIHTVAPVSNIVKKVIDHRLVLVGDASGFLDPLTGEGISYALWGADMLTRCLSGVDLNSEKDINRALKKYSRLKYRNFFFKSLINQGFQFMIRNPWMTKILANILHRDEYKRSLFIGIVSNIFKPSTAFILWMKRFFTKS